MDDFLFVMRLARQHPAIRLDWVVEVHSMSDYQFSLFFQCRIAVHDTVNICTYLVLPID